MDLTENWQETSFCASRAQPSRVSTLALSPENLLGGFCRGNDEGWDVSEVEAVERPGSHGKMIPVGCTKGLLEEGWEISVHLWHILCRMSC